jgi:FkbM family methyltransferase
MRNLKYFLATYGSMLLGRTSLFRLGRWAYMTARNDVPNRISENGEKWVQSCVLKACRDNNSGRVVVFDIGANIGDWLRSLFDVAERLGCLRQLAVHAFEPVPSTYERLLNMIKIDQRATTAIIKPECLAMSSSRGSASMSIVGDGVGINSLHQDSTTAYTESIVIVTNTVDHYFQENNIKMVHLLKCDTEGHDMEVLRGAQDALRHERVRVLQFEYNHRWVFSRNFLKDAFDLVAGLPYTIGKVTSSRVEFYSEWHPELERFFEANFVIVHDDARRWFLHQNMAFDTSNAIYAE